MFKLNTGGFTNVHGIRELGPKDDVEFGVVLSDLYARMNEEAELSTDHHLEACWIRGKVGDSRSQPVNHK